MSPEDTELVRSGLPIVRAIAWSIVKRCGPNVELGDLVGAGAEGLLHAVARYEPDRGTPFTLYIRSRIRGAILDSLRSNDVLTRYARTRVNNVDKALHQLRHTLERGPTAAELASCLTGSKWGGPVGLTLDEYGQLLRRVPVNIDNLYSMNPAPDECLIASEDTRALACAVGTLSARQRRVLALHYWHERTQGATVRRALAG